MAYVYIFIPYHTSLGEEGREGDNDALAAIVLLRDPCRSVEEYGVSVYRPSITSIIYFHYSFTSTVSCTVTKRIGHRDLLK